jgi:fermentation-respiration switch protein FrsA (DUF1100 family)
MNTRALVLAALSIGSSACKLDKTVFSGDVTKSYTITSTIIHDSLRKEVQFVSGGYTLYGYYLKQPNAPVRATVIFSHGKGGNLAQDEEWSHAEKLWQIGNNVLTYDYRGFGKSEGDSEDETTLIADAKAALAFALTQPGVTLPRTVSYGHSLGSAPAIALAAAMPGMRSLIVESGFSSGQAMAQTANPLNFPVRWLLKEPMINVDKIKLVTSPVLILHGDADIQIPVDQGRELFAAATSTTKKLEIIAGAGHNDIPDKLGIVGWGTKVLSFTFIP